MTGIRNLQKHNYLQLYTSRTKLDYIELTNQIRTNKCLSLYNQRESRSRTNYMYINLRLEIMNISKKGIKYYTRKYWYLKKQRKRTGIHRSIIFTQTNNSCLTIKKTLSNYQINKQKETSSLSGKD